MGQVEREKYKEILIQMEREPIVQEFINNEDPYLVERYLDIIVLKTIKEHSDKNFKESLESLKMLTFKHYAIDIADRFNDNNDKDVLEDLSDFEVQKLLIGNGCFSHDYGENLKRIKETLDFLPIVKSIFKERWKE